MLETLDWRIAQLQLFIYLFIYFWEGRGGEGCGRVWEGGEFRIHYAPDILPSIFSLLAFFSRLSLALRLVLHELFHVAFVLNSWILDLQLFTRPLQAWLLLFGDRITLTFLVNFQYSLPFVASLNAVPTNSHVLTF